MKLLEKFISGKIIQSYIMFHQILKKASVLVDTCFSLIFSPGTNPRRVFGAAGVADDDDDEVAAAGCSDDWVFSLASLVDVGSTELIVLRRI